MPILMKYPSITGESELNGKVGFLILGSMAWGVARSSAAVNSGARGDADCRVEEISISRQMDSVSAMLLSEALLGRFDRKVEIHLARTGPNRLLTYASYELEGCGIISYNMETGGDVPVERMRLNFTRILFNSYKIDDDLAAVPNSVNYDLKRGA